MCKREYEKEVFEILASDRFHTADFERRIKNLLNPFFWTDTVVLENNRVDQWQWYHAVKLFSSKALLQHVLDVVPERPDLTPHTATAGEVWLATVIRSRSRLERSWETRISRGEKVNCTIEDWEKLLAAWSVRPDANDVVEGEDCHDLTPFDPLGFPVCPDGRDASIDRKQARAEVDRLATAAINYDGWKTVKVVDLEPEVAAIYKRANSALAMEELSKIVPPEVLRQFSKRLRDAAKKPRGKKAKTWSPPAQPLVYTPGLPKKGRCK